MGARAFPPPYHTAIGNTSFGAALPGTAQATRRSPRARPSLLRKRVTGFHDRRRDGSAAAAVARHGKLPRSARIAGSRITSVFESASWPPLTSASGAAPRGRPLAAVSPGGLTGMAECHGSYGTLPRHRRIAGQGVDPREVPRQGFPGRRLLRPRARPREEGHLGRPREELRAQVPHRPGEGEDGRRPGEVRPQGRPHLPGRRPRPRGRGHLLAPARAAEEGGAEGHVPPRRVPRDHEGRGCPRDRQAREDLEGPGGSAAGPAHHRPAGRLRGLGAALEQRLARPVRRPRADGRAADHRRARDRA